MKETFEKAQAVTQKHSGSSTPTEPQPGPQTLEAWALLMIHDRRIYQPKYRSFGEYLRKRWGIKRSRGYRLLQ